MKTLKILLILIFCATISACHKDDENIPDPPTPDVRAVNSMHLLNSTGGESDYQITYTSFNKIASITKTEGLDVKTTTYSYDPISKKLESYIEMYDDGTSATFDILYDAAGNLTGINDSGFIYPITETATTLTVEVYGVLSTFTFNEVGQILGIQTPTETTVFNIDANIKGPLYDVDMDRIFFITDIDQLLLLPKQGMNSVNNLYTQDFYFTNTVDAEGYVTSSQVDGDPIDPTSPESTINYTYTNLETSL